jgi:hypothetical protein
LQEERQFLPVLEHIGNTDEISVTRQAVYNKLKRLEPHVPAALVHYSAEELLPCVRAGKPQANSGKAATKADLKSL